LGLPETSTGQSAYFYVRHPRQTRVVSATPRKYLACLVQSPY
jgi:hypothetical protein